MENLEKEREFILILEGADEPTEQIEDGLFEAGCDDATLTFRSGVPRLTFTRHARSMREALLSAIRDVAKANVGLRVVRIDECNLVTLAEIGRRTDRSKQIVHMYATGQRGPGSFPPPVCEITEGQPLWRWCEVAFWLHTHGMLSDEEYVEAREIDTINVILDYYRQAKIDPALIAEVLAVVQDNPTPDPAASASRRS